MFYLIMNRHADKFGNTGAVGIEMASELAVVHPSQRITLIHSHDRLLSSEPLPIEVADLALTSLREQGIEVVLGQRVNSSVEVEEGKYALRLSDGTERTTGFVIWAISKQHPSTAYLPKEVHNEESELVEIKNTYDILFPAIKPLFNVI
jgi:NADH dehydrogenase FAD-containing subunit